MTSVVETPLRRTRFLLGCGTVAGLLFPVLSFGQAFTRPGFELRRHALSSLTLGDLGWLQVIAFAGTGVLAVAFAVGLWQALRPGRAGTVVPVLVGVYGVAMVGGGIFVPDPALGWPPGAPAGLPEQASTGSVLHTVCGAAAFLSLIAAGLLLARRFAGQGDRNWALYSAASGAVAFVLTALPWSEGSASIRFAVGAVLISGWLVALSWRARDEVA
ncbi:DUF998 domain-containing protein [Micromonospora sp. D93]|uniref:DUF998 domain-containing protein n=1 Tax=Micromonospora sp. D93 TaxID=2824886 RepID=UPI001B37B366|nr:DUF998 domain-containing protein [Micromonospora sp. D93]MBQ1020095.1 DUF998 domain-containing protein [Micromonospora sp. D93]